MTSVFPFQPTNISGIHLLYKDYCTHTLTLATLGARFENAESYVQWKGARVQLCPSQTQNESLSSLSQ